jgi:hypothetical protein
MYLYAAANLPMTAELAMVLAFHLINLRLQFTNSSFQNDDVCLHLLLLLLLLLLLFGGGVTVAFYWSAGSCFCSLLVVNAS